MAVKKEKQMSGAINQKLLFVIIGVFLLIVVAYILFPKGGTYNINQPINAQEYTFVSALNNGEMTIGETTGNIITGNDIYKNTAPKITYSENNPVIYKLESGDQQKEIRNVALPNNLSTTINAAVGNGNLTLNARNLQLQQAEIAVGNGNLTITIPEQTQLNGKLQLGNGNLIIQLPENNQLDGVRFRFPEGVVVPDMNLGESFHKTVDGYETNNYKEGGKNTELFITIGNGNIDISSIE